MKRVILRLTALSAVVALGIVVIVRAQRGAEPELVGQGIAAESSEWSAAAGKVMAAEPEPARVAEAAHNHLRADKASPSVAAQATTPSPETPRDRWPLGSDPFAVAPSASTTAGEQSSRTSRVIPAGDYRSSAPTAGPEATAAVATSPVGSAEIPSAQTGALPGHGQIAGQPPAAPPGSGMGPTAPQMSPAFPGVSGPSQVEPRRLPADLGATPATPSIPAMETAGSPPIVLNDGSNAAGSNAAGSNAAGDNDAGGQLAPGMQPPQGAQADLGGLQSGAAGLLPRPGEVPSAAEAGISSSAPAAGLQPGGTVAAEIGEGTGRPGAKQLEGPQSSQVTIEKIAPEGVQVGQIATFRLVVRNTGSVVATDVEVRDEVPKGSRLVQTTPQAARGAAGELVWKLGSLQPGQEVTIEMQVVPLEEGELGSVARVSFEAEATARCVVTKPQLVLETTGPEQVLIGEQATLKILLSNTGTGIARGVVLEEHVPGTLQHPAGADLEYVVGDLQPGESRQLELVLTAQRPGPATNVLIARGEGNLQTENRFALEVTAPRLEVAVEGGQRRFLEREATYHFFVSNSGTAPAEQVELVAQLPPGLEFVRANNAGYYEQSDHTVRWRLAELPVGEQGAVELVTMPVQAGQHEIKLRATAARGAEAETTHAVVVEGIAALLFQAADVVDPIQVGEETSYEIRVVNQGTKAATGVMLAVLLPPEMRPVAAEGPTAHRIDAQNRVIFEPLARLAPKADTTYRVRVQGVRPGDLRVRVQLVADDMQAPVTKEESTRVYSDQ